jgi:uncharacterized lipoprotein YmbA
MKRFNIFLPARAHLSFSRLAGSDALFPLTPSLSLKERENDRLSVVTLGHLGLKRDGGIELPLPEGDGRGEGKESARSHRRAQKITCVLLALLCGLVASGCLFKKKREPTRDFVLTLMPASESGSAPARPLQIEVGFVKMPSYLLRESLIVRKSANEFHYLDNAQWAERLDQCFRRTLTENLSSLLVSGQTHPTSADETESKVLVSVAVKQFDVDTQGQGTLLATWSVTFPGSDESAKSGHAQLHQDGPSPQGNPQIVVATLSALTAQFSRDLAKEIRASNWDRQHESNPKPGAGR